MGVSRENLGYFFVKLRKMKWLPRQFAAAHAKTPQGK
jgi:hypothetical protein